MEEIIVIIITFISLLNIVFCTRFDCYYCEYIREMHHYCYSLVHYISTHHRTERDISMIASQLSNVIRRPIRDLYRDLYPGISITVRLLTREVIYCRFNCHVVCETQLYRHTCVYYENYILNMELQETCKYYTTVRIEGKFNRDDYYGEINVSTSPSNKNNNSLLQLCVIKIMIAAKCILLDLYILDKNCIATSIPICSTTSFYILQMSVPKLNVDCDATV